MDSTLNSGVNSSVSAPSGSRLAAVREVRSWRAGQWLPVRVATLLMPILAVLAWVFLALNTAQARVQIDHDPMRPPAAALPAPAAASGATEAAPATPTTPAMPTLKITRQIGANAISALVNDTWVRRGDVVAGYRVTAVRTESIDLVSMAEPGLRLTLRLNPVTVDRADTAKPAPAWPALALEKK
jgi:hypothetical protein